jgi:mycothiol system anti-sigma-R factor
MDCHEWFDKLYLILDRADDQIMWKDVEEHMKECRPCWDRYEFEVKLRERLKSSCSRERCTESFRQHIKALLEKF